MEFTREEQAARGDGRAARHASRARAGHPAARAGHPAGGGALRRRAAPPGQPGPRRRRPLHERRRARVRRAWWPSGARVRVPGSLNAAARAIRRWEAFPPVAGRGDRARRARRRAPHDPAGWTDTSRDDDADRRLGVRAHPAGARLLDLHEPGGGSAGPPGRARGGGDPPAMLRNSARQAPCAARPAGACDRPRRRGVRRGRAVDSPDAASVSFHTVWMRSRY